MTSTKTRALAATTGLALAATGVVFGDIGASPVYALKQTLAVSGSSREAVLGAVSLIFRALILILIGTALLFGHGALTPAISVLSGTEGLAIVNPSLEHWAVPLTVVILAALFAVQSRGTHQIGRVFGPVMVLWFVVILAVRLVWAVLIAPSLVLCYLGRAAAVIKDPSAAADPFFSLAPNPPSRCS